MGISCACRRERYGARWMNDESTDKSPQEARSRAPTRYLLFIFQTIAEIFLVIYLKEYLSPLLVGTDLAAYLLVIMKLSRSPRSAHITYSADQLTSRPRFKKHPSLDTSPNSQGDFTTRTAIRKWTRTC